ncbi:PHP domain-containing protein [Paenibacillus thalictri]|uniref:PHP domain-containing protein n=1 Tax=Paenibacillus thalictri TaxID=2527873 RepID=A0A4Q9DSS6_9BACL|nr:PHP domain-containing protein [Paenibacillus thalictri]TBL78319.1 PHP domain-containing protein [Paenibacillus thalictri]
MERSYADLHSHTTASDGTQSPAANVRLAQAVGLAAIAITDHDTVAGVEEALAEGKTIGIHVVPGVEISTVALGQDIHVLGLYIDHTDPVLLARLAELREVRDRRNELMLGKLAELGMHITMEDVLAQKELSGGDETIGRPHIAAALMSKGYVAAISEAFEKYLGKSGAAYINPPRIHPRTAIEWIREAGGTPVLAHPGLYGADELIPELAGAGLEGLEVYHSDHTPEQELKYARIAEGLNLIVTAGSDFHGERGGEMIHAMMGSRKIDSAVLTKLNKRGERADENS